MVFSLLLQEPAKCSTTPPTGPVATSDLTAISSLAVDSKNLVYAADGSIGPVGAVFLDQANIYVISSGGTIALLQGSPFPPGPAARLAIDSKDRLYILTGTNVLRVPPGSAPETFPHAGRFGCRLHRWTGGRSAVCRCGAFSSHWSSTDQMCASRMVPRRVMHRSQCLLAEPQPASK
jgi:hypothetical protein